jgi:AraC-like DNA-binding protein
VAVNRQAISWDIHRLDIDLSPQTPLACTETHHPRKTSIVYDMHYALELGVVLTGRMRRVYPQYEMVARPGDIWICGMWEPHGCQCLCDNVRVLVFTVWPPLLADMRWAEAPRFNWLLPFVVPPKDRPRATAKSRKWFAGLGKRIRELKSEAEPRGKLELRLCFLEILLRITRDWNPPADRREVPTGAFSKVNRAIEIVFANRRLIPVQEVAAACGMSRNRFGRLFQEVVGISFPQFSLRYRLSGAANQLVCSDEATKRIARDWGFADDSHLHKAFVEHYGLTPTEYRRRAR